MCRLQEKEEGLCYLSPDPIELADTEARQCVQWYNGRLITREELSGSINSLNVDMMPGRYYIHETEENKVILAINGQYEV